MRLAVCKSRLIGLLLGIIAAINRNAAAKCLYLSFCTGYEALAARQHLVNAAQEATTSLVPVRVSARGASARTAPSRITTLMNFNHYDGRNPRRSSASRRSHTSTLDAANQPRKSIQVDRAALPGRIIYGLRFAPRRAKEEGDLGARREREIRPPRPSRPDWNLGSLVRTRRARGVGGGGGEAAE